MTRHDYFVCCANTISRHLYYDIRAKGLHPRIQFNDTTDNTAYAN